jgi:FkbM family methyltransferase
VAYTGQPLAETATPLPERSAYPLGTRGNALQRAFAVVRFLAGVVDRSLHILGTLPQETRGAVLRTYLRLKWHHFLRKLRPSLQFPQEKLFGQPFHLADHLSLVGMFECMFLEREYDFQTVQERPFILDCGSNVGLSLLSFKRQYPHSRILAFEPDPAAFRLLQQNVRQFGWSDIELHNCAVLDREGMVDFYSEPQQPASVIASTDAGCGLTSAGKVPAVALSRFIEDDVDLLKLDIEGAERAVLAELAASGRLARVRQIIFEYHHHLRGPQDDSFSRVLRLLEENGMGYELSAYPSRPFARGRFSCVMVYAYRKAAC